LENLILGGKNMRSHTYKKVEPADITTIIHDYSIDNSEEGIKFIKECILDTVPYLVARTREELTGLLTLDEARFIASIFNSTVYSNHIPAKAYLTNMVLDAIELGSYDTIYNVDKKAILDKLENLTEFQAYIIITMAYSFLKNTQGFFNEEHIKKFFNIN
jgi:hypothetical protein